MTETSQGRHLQPNLWWRLEIGEIAKALGTDLERGLGGAEAVEKRKRYGLNQLKQAPPVSPWMLFLGQFKGVVIWVLVAAAVVSGFCGEWVDTLIIFAIVVLNAVMGFVQEFRAEQSLAALKKLASPMAKVLRDGKHQVIPSKKVVPGDIIELEAGDNVPADAPLFWITSHTTVQEASLTGESTAVSKSVETLPAEEVALGDRVNMVCMGTSVTNGRARAVVTATGMDTELGHIAGMMSGIVDEMTPLQEKLERFGKKLVVVCLVLVGLVFVLGWLHGGDLMETLLTAVSLAVAAIPEGLPAVVTIALALGVQRMVKRHALIRKLPSVETLGCATVICSDKTGTLTKNEMTVQAIYAGSKWFQVSGTGYEPKGKFTMAGRPVDPASDPDLAMTLKTGLLCNGAQLVQADGDYKVVGDPTEGCLITVAELAEQVERIAVYARVSPEHKLRVISAWRSRGQIVAMTGDGVNDAPALKEADIGVAMGITGTDVTKEVADMVVTDDNFASIVAAVEEGRGVYDNIRKFIHYLLSCNAGEIMVMLIASLFGLPTPLLAVHILWINLVTDGLPALALGVDPIDPKAMKRPPRPPAEPVVTKRGGAMLLAQGFLLALCCLGAFVYVLKIEDGGIERARTAAFMILACSQLFHAFNCRSLKESLFKIGITTNPKLIAAVVVSFGLQAAVIYVPFLQRAFRIEPFGLRDWILVLLVSSIPLWVMEVTKALTSANGDIET